MRIAKSAIILVLFCVTTTALSHSVSARIRWHTPNKDDDWYMYLPLVLKPFCIPEGLWECEPNDSFLEANGPLSSRQEYFGYPDDQDDFFSIYLFTGGLITVDLTDYTNGAQLFLYHGENEKGWVNAPPYHIAHTGSTGRYYIRVFTPPEHQNATTPYTLQMTFPMPTPTPTSTATPTPTSTPTSTMTPTSTPTATPTPEWCRSFRPPLRDSGHPGEFEIVRPEDCAEGLSHTGVQIAGTYTGIPPEEEENLEVWVLVYPPDHRYYPQSNDCHSKSPADFGGGRWSVRGNLGQEGITEDFDILVVVTDKGSNASTRFKQYLGEGCPDNDYKGIPRSEMPTDLTEKTSIRVRAGTAIPTPTPTPGPMPDWCESFRPPLGDSGHPGEFEILRPENCADNLPQTTEIGGTYTGIPPEDEENLEVWALVYPPDNEYYPQSNDCHSERPAEFGGGVWTVTGHLGREGISEVFDIVVVVTNKWSSASGRFKQYLRDGCPTDTYAGIPRSQIPTDLTEKASITVRSRGE